MHRPKRIRLKPADDSTAFSGYHYDPIAHTLTVRWRQSGQTWRYDGVNLERGTAFEGASSKGRYFADQIRPHHEGREVFTDADD